MKGEPHWQLAIAPSSGVSAAYLFAHVLGARLITALVLASMSGVLAVAVVAVLARQETLRARQSYDAQLIAARRESRNSSRYARSQTRRFFRVSGADQYIPDSPTSLAESQRLSRNLSINPNPTAAVHELIPSARPSSGGPIAARNLEHPVSLRRKRASHAKPNEKTKRNLA
jgi:hypothetical protein